MNVKELRAASPKELEEELHALCKELFTLRMMKGGGKNVSKPHQFSKARRAIARIKTVINERKAKGNE